MKWLLYSLIVFICAATLTACHGVSPDADSEAVIVRKPWFFGHGGVDRDAVLPGQKWVAWTTSSWEYKTTPVQFREAFDDLITDDNNPVDFDVYAELQIMKGGGPTLLENFGENWYTNNVSPYLRKLVRDLASQQKTFDLAGNREVLTQIEDFIHKELGRFLKEKNMPVMVNRVVMGKVTPPAAVLEETMKTAAQNQAKLTQKARAEAEDARAFADKKKAIADDTYRVTFGMTTAEYLHLRKLEIEKEKIELIRDKQNVTVILSETGGVPVTFPVK